jgi:SAM-dependent methyltransferase
VYWTGHGYNLTMRVLYGGDYARVEAAVAARIADGASVVDVCCGTARLHREFLRARGCSYLGLDFNGDFVMHARRRGTDARWFDLERDPLPSADYVVICSSLYHFTNRADEIVTKLRRAARRAVIISEPVKNLSQLPALGRLAAALTDPGTGDGDGHRRRFDLATFSALVERHGGTVVHGAGERNALAEIPPLLG